MRALFDTAVFIYAVGGKHPHREPCRELVHLLAEEEITADISAEAVQEYLHVRTRKGVGRSQAVDEARSIVALCRVHDVTMTELQVGLQLFRTHGDLHMRDAIHAATALACQASVLVSPDRAFDDVPGIERLDPAEALERLAA
jgi:hypothetical protein